MDFTAPSFSLGIDLDDDDTAPAAESHPRGQSRGCAAAAPDPPSFSLGFDFDDDDDEEQRLPVEGREAERGRVSAAPDPPSFSLGVGLDDDDEEPQLPTGGRREERAPRYEAPGPPSSSLRIDYDQDFLPRDKQAQSQVAPRAASSTGMEVEEDDFALNGGRPVSPPSEANRFKRLRKGSAPPHQAPTPQMWRYKEPGTTTSLRNVDDDLLPGDQHQEQSRPQAELRVPPPPVRVEEEDDDFFVTGGRQSQCEILNPEPVPPSTRLKRLQRGPEPPHLAPKPPLPKAPKLFVAETSPTVTGKGTLDVGSLEDEIEDFTDDERPLQDVPPSVGSCSSNSKFSLSALMSQSATKAKISRFKQQSVSSASKSLEESCTKKLLPRITMSPMRKIHLLDSDTDLDDDWNQNKAKKPVSPLKNIKESINSYIQKDPTLQQNSKPQGSTAAWKSKATVDDNWATPALDEFCSEYFNSIKESGQSQQKKSSNFYHSNVPQLKSIGEMAGHLYQSSSIGAVLDDNPTDNSPPAMHYFFHHDPMVRDLVRERLQHFFPIGTESTRGNEQNRGENLSYSQLGSDGAATNMWVTPRGRISVPTDVGRRRVHASGTQSGSGHWYTGDDGRKVYVSKNGQELTGQNAYRQYKKESGRGFHKYRKKGAAKQGSSSGKRGSAKPKKEPATTKQGTGRARRKR